MASTPFALVEIGALFDEGVETVGRLVLESPAFDKALKVLPLPEALRRLNKDTEKATQTQLKSDKKKVVKVSDAVRIINEEWNKLNEVGELASTFWFPASAIDPETGKAPLSPKERCISRVRLAALSQKSKKHTANVYRSRKGFPRTKYFFCGSKKRGRPKGS